MLNPLALLPNDKRFHEVKKFYVGKCFSTIQDHLQIIDHLHSASPDAIILSMNSLGSE